MQSESRTKSLVTRHAYAGQVPLSGRAHTKVAHKFCCLAMSKLFYSNLDFNVSIESARHFQSLAEYCRTQPSIQLKIVYPLCDIICMHCLSNYCIV